MIKVLLTTKIGTKRCYCHSVTCQLSVAIQHTCVSMWDFLKEVSRENNFVGKEWTFAPRKVDFFLSMLLKIGHLSRGSADS